MEEGRAQGDRIVKPASLLNQGCTRKERGGDRHVCYIDVLQCYMDLWATGYLLVIEDSNNYLY